MTDTQRAALIEAADYLTTDGASMEWDEIERIAEVLREMAGQETAQMTDLRAAAQQAMEALEWVETKLRYAAITALRTALAEAYENEAWNAYDKATAEPAEPVAWLFTNLQSGDYDFCYQEDEHDHDREMWHKQPLYTAPPPRTPLTDEDLDALRQDARGLNFVTLREFRVIARAIEAAHGITNQETN